MKSLMSLWSILALECAGRCSTSATMDIVRVQERIKHEGLSFLTITLPSFGKDFERGLDQGYVDSNLFQGFSWRGGLPKFLWGFLRRVFDARVGVLLDDADPEAIQSIRQLTLMFGKMNLDCSPERVQESFDSYIQTEVDVAHFCATESTIDFDGFDRISSMLFASMFSTLDLSVFRGDMVPKHGPGSVADRLSSNAKYNLKRWTSRLDKVFPVVEYLLPNASHWESLDDVDIVSPRDEIPVRVISVPKTQKGPRIIAIEPTEMQYAQQSLMQMIYHYISHPRTFWARVLRRMISFDDQEPNRLLALKGSSDGSLATLDLSEASDRVSTVHVEHLLRNHKHLRDAVFACRSLRADVPGHGVIPLSKFASMGSALCFPFEAMVFLTVVFLGIERARSTPMSPKLIRELSGSVRVFGDDIIVPVDCAESVAECLETFGFKVNSAKSFWTGKFRESCGGDFYDGNEITVVKVRRMFPTSRRHAPEVAAIVSLRNQLYEFGYWKTVRWLDSYIRKLLVHFPNVARTSSVLGRLSFLGFSIERQHPTLHKPLVRGYRMVSKPPKDPLDGVGALLKWFLMTHNHEGPIKDREVLDEDHLERAGRPHVVHIRMGWSSPV